MTDKIPKSRQIRFFMMPEETAKALTFIKEQDCNIYKPKSTTSEPSLFTILDKPGQLYYCPKDKDFCDNITTHKITDSLYTIDTSTSPVIEFDCSCLYENCLFVGRLYFLGGYMGREQWISFPDALYESFKKVSSFMKRCIFSKDREYQAYLSKGSQLFAANGGKLSQ